MTDITMISVATPRAIPMREKKVIIEKKLSLVFGNKYLVDKKNSKLLIMVN
tara:strand:+ start:226 stop:378 length:153 start_codon:yes stop_codon:yes gene_type:complete